MHSRIFQLEKEKIQKNEFVTEDDLRESFIDVNSGSIDYISDETNIEEDIEWFLSSYEKCGIEYNKEEKSIIFKKDFKKNYFTPRYKELLEHVSKITLDKFASGGNISLLKNIISEEYGFYIYTDDHWMSLDDFIRYNLEEERTYYFGNTIDYHF